MEELHEEVAAAGQPGSCREAGVEENIPDLEDALTFFRSRLFESPGRYALDYLTVKRGYTRHEIEGMELGFFPPRQEVKIALGEGIFETLGLDMLKGFGRTHKIVIPYRDPGGRLKGFIVRRIDSNRPKYIYSTHVERDTLFNLPAVKSVEAVYVTEGYFDALIATRRGIRGVVATGFSALTEGMLEGLMGRGIKCITLIPDNDTAGLRGAAASLALLNGKAVQTLVLELPEHYKDLDEFLRHEGMESFEKLAGRVIRPENWDVQALLSRRSNIKVQIKSAGKNRTAHTYYISRGNPYRQE